MLNINGKNVGNILVQLQYQTELNALLIDSILNNEEPRTQDEVQKIKKKAIRIVNDSYGKEIIQID